MKKLVLLLVLLGVCAEAAAAQTTAVLGTKVLNGSGTLLSSGQWCFASTCLTVTGGAFTGSVASGTQTITVKDGSGTTYLTVPSAVISGAAFDWDTFILTSGMTASGVGSPRLACQVGATYTQTDAGNLAWYSVSQNGVCVWTTSGGGGGTPATAGLYAGPGAPTFQCTSPCHYTQSNASPASSAAWELIAPSGAVSTDWVLQTGAEGPAGPAGPPMSFLGAYNSGTTYAAGQVVSYSNASYASLIGGNVGNEPDTATSDWTLVAAPGGIANASLANLVSRLPLGANLLNVATVHSGYYASSVDGTLVASSGFYVSDYIPANSGGQMVSSLPVHVEEAGLCFYDQNLSFISALGGIAAGTPFSVPSNAMFVRITASAPGDNTFSTSPSPSQVNTWMVAWGATLPASYQSFAAASAVQIVSSVLSLVPHIPTGVNVLDPSAVTQGYYLNEADGTVVAGNQIMVSDYMLANPGGEMVSNFGIHVGASGAAFYDANKNYISGVSNVADNVPFSVPSNAVYVRMTPALVNGTDLTNPSGWMVAWGSTLPANYVPFRPSQASVSPAAGSRMGVIGDSISAIFSDAWQNVVTSRLGMSITFQDARPGRQWSQAFENYGDPSVGGTLSIYDPTYVYPGCSTNCGTASEYPDVGEASGSTFASNIADVDVLVIRLGTNDETYTVGTLGDATNSGTLYGNMAWVVQTILAANPTVRVLMVGPELNSQASLANIQAVDAAEQTFANAYAIPYLSLLKVSGNNSFTTSTYTRDGIHPSDWAFAHVDGPAIAQFIQQWR
jgi:hypothetical protein